MTPEADRDELPSQPTLLISAHGISQRERRRLEEAGKQIVDTTCPLVRRVQRASQTLAQDGFHILIIGRAAHVEVRGVIEDLEGFDVLESVADVRTWPYAKLGIVCQTTVPPGLADSIRAAVRRANPGSEIRFIDTICQPTRDRQESVERLLRKVDGMVVVGGSNSHNTRQLAERCRTAGIPTWHVQGACDLVPAWFRGIRVVGLTAGTSTTDDTIEEVYRALCRVPSGTPKSSGQWLSHFRRNAANPQAIPWGQSRGLSGAERVAVLRSIQVFQLGESGGGSRLLRTAETYAAQSGDAAYPAAVRLFVQEEQRHSDLLGRFLDSENVPRLGRQWTNGFFRRIRNLAGLELMLSILLTAELLARVYYAALRRATGSEALRAICRRILHDEAWHVRFQCQLLGQLQKKRAPFLRTLTGAAHRRFYQATCLIVWATHFGVFRASGLSFRQYRQRARCQWNLATRWIHGASETRES